MIRIVNIFTSVHFTSVQNKHFSDLEAIIQSISPHVLSKSPFLNLWKLACERHKKQYYMLHYYSNYTALDILENHGFKLTSTWCSVFLCMYLCDFQKSKWQTLKNSCWPFFSNFRHRGWNYPIPVQSTSRYINTKKFSARSQVLAL